MCHADTCQYEARDSGCQSDAARHDVCQAETRQSGSSRAFVVLDLQDSNEDAKRHRKFKLCKHLFKTNNYDPVNDSCISDTRFSKKGQIVSRSCQTDQLDNVVWMLDECDIDRPIFVRRKSTKRDKHRNQASKEFKSEKSDVTSKSESKDPLSHSVATNLSLTSQSGPNSLFDEAMTSNESCQTSFIDTRVTNETCHNVMFEIPLKPLEGPSDRCQIIDTPLTGRPKDRESDKSDQGPFAIYDGKINIPMRF
ncbi:unnamed protein product [Pieris macdunnoughi]|uniref:Uncharacterized protein n=1 Tax=Pieris macdunnoughi TaxID=345717 RepID=A0A821WFM1_9NEOP|nr:unnamed protein product [Pieris macdunnoughi]